MKGLNSIEVLERLVEDGEGPVSHKRLVRVVEGLDPVRMQDELRLPESLLDIFILLHIGHSEQLPLVALPEHILQRAQEDSDVVRVLSTGPLLQKSNKKKKLTTMLFSYFR